MLGLLYAAPYVGALGATLFSGWINRVRRQGVGVMVSASAWGAAVIVFGFSESLWPALVALAFAGAADMVSAVLRTVMVIDVTPDAMRGRVAGGVACITGSLLISLLLPALLRYDAADARAARRARELTGAAEAVAT